MKKCIVCNSNKIKKIELSIGKIKICEVCGLINILGNNDLNYYFNEEYYQEAGDFYNYSSRPELVNQFETIITRKKHENLKILDIGCGYGDLFELAKKHNWIAYGIELSKPAYEYCKKKYDFDIYNIKLDETNFQENSFDIITMSNVIGYFENIFLELKIIFKILKPGGQLIIRDPNGFFYKYLYLYFNLINKKSEHYYSNWLYIYNQKNFNILMNRIGFNKIVFEPSILVSRTQKLKKLFVKIISFFSKIISKCTFNKIIISPALFLICSKPER